MNFIRDSYRYLFKNFFKILLLVLPVSALVGFFDIYKPISFFETCKETAFTSYWQMFSSFVNLNVLSLVTFLIFIPLIIFTISVCLAGEESHMRTGRFSFKTAFKRSVYYFFPVFSLALIFILICAAVVFIVPAVDYFIYFMLTGSGEIMTRTTLLLCVIVNAVFGLVVFVFLSIFLNAINLISINNYSLKSSLSNTLSLLEGKFFKFFFNLILPYMVIIPVVWFTNSLVVYPLVASLLFAIQLAFTLSLSMVTYFNISGTQRKDNIGGYFIKGTK